MSRTLGSRRWWKTIVPKALLAALVALPPTAGTVAAGYQGTIDTNTTAFNPPCRPAANSYPAKMASAASAAYTSLRYTAALYSGSSFTEAQVLSRTSTDYGYYVHSHGDLYAYGSTADSGFRADGGNCSGAIVNAAEIKAVRRGRMSNLIVMSTCHLGEPAATMSDAFAIAKQKFTTTWGGNRFYLGYYGAAWDSDEWIFEQAFWSSLRSGSSVGTAFDTAMSKTFAHPFAANWWGSYTYFGFAGPYITCPKCS